MKYFVTGATGFIGGKVARQLRDAGHQVVTLARTPSKAQDLVDLGVQVFPGDITDKESLRAPMTGVDGIFHIAAWYKIGDAKERAEAEKINVDGTRNVLEMMKELKIPRGVYTSTLAVFSDTHGQVVDESYRHNGPWLSEYDRTKWRAHYEIALPMMQGGLPVIIVQPGLVYGPGDTSQVHSTFVDYLQRKLPMLPLKTAYCWAHVDDTARGHIVAMEKGKVGETYIIAGPVHPLIEAMELAEKITGVPAPRLKAAPALLKVSAAIMGAVNSVVRVPQTFHPEILRGAAGVTYLGSNEKAKRELGFTLHDWEDGMRETLEYEMRQLGMKS